MPILLRDADGNEQSIATLNDVLDALGPAKRWAPVVPNNDTVLENVVGLKIGGAGTVIAVDGAGNSGTFTCFAGEYLPIAATKIMAASTATSIVALKSA